MGDTKEAEYCLKDVHLLHKWVKIQQNMEPIDFVTQLETKKFTDVDTMGSAACLGGGCEISF
jgi:ribonucleoside-diphosphate reductase alpha chain